MKKLSFLASLFLTAILALSAALCTAQDSIQYQLVIRNAAGQLITNKLVNMKFSLISGGQSFYEETQKTTTDKYGNISVFVGTGTAVKGAMKDVPWSTMDISMKVEADTDGGSSFKELGTVPMAAAPYAMYAATAGGNGSSGSSKDDEALFEVCDRDGQPVFAVYDNGIVVYVDETAKAPRSGFVVTGRSTKDGESADYFSVDAEGTHVYVDDEADNTKAKRSGLVVTGRNTKSAGGSYTAERTVGKSAGADIFAVESGITHVYINEGESKAPRSGFVVTGRSTKGEGVVNISTARTNLLTNELNIAGKADENVEPQPGEEPTQSQSLFTISGGQVGVNTGITMLGDVEKKVEAEIVEEYDITVDDTEIFTEVPCGDYLPNVPGYALMAIYSEDSYVAVSKNDGEYIILFDEFGNITKQHSRAAALLVLNGKTSSMYIRPLRPMNHTIEFGLMDAENATSAPYEFVKLTAKIEAAEGHPFATVETEHGRVGVKGDLFYGEYVEFTAEPDNGYFFTNWEGMVDHSYTYSSTISINYEPRVPKFAKAELFVGGENASDDDMDDGQGFSADKPFASISRATEVMQYYSQHNVNWTIKVSGTAEGNHVIDGRNIANSITIKGSTPLGSGTEPHDVLTVGGTYSGSVLTINTGVSVIISNLKITGGTDSGIKMINESDNGNASLTLNKGVLITGNGMTEFYGGGVCVNAGKLTLNNGCVIKGNDAFLGGGVYVNGSESSLTMNSGSVISENKAIEGGGVYIEEEGSFAMDGGQISGNEANMGGGVYYNNGTFVISGNATVDANNEVLIQQDKYVTVSNLKGSGKVAVITLAVREIGVPVVKSLNDAKLPSNILKRFEIGNDLLGMKVNGEDNTEIISTEIQPIFVGPNETEDEDGSIDSPFKTIAGAIETLNDATANYVIMVNGTITGSQTIGGEINSSSVTLKANRVAIIGANGTADGPTDVLDGNEEGIVLTINTPTPIVIGNLKITNGNNNGYGGGGGLHIINETKVTLDAGTLITGNKAFKSGGGVYVYGPNTEIIMQPGSKITNNTVTNASEQGEDGGCGIFICGGNGDVSQYAKFTMNGGEISDNSGSGNKNGGFLRGGGVRLKQTNFVIKEGALITRNKTIHLGGNMYVDQTIGLIEGGEISYGVAEYKGNYDAAGAGIWLQTSTITMTGGEICNNKVISYGQEGHGAGVAIFSMSSFTMTGGEISGNYFEGGDDLRGGAVYVYDLSMPDAPAVPFTLGGSASIPFGVFDEQGVIQETIGMNDIYLANNNSITITGDLSSEEGFMVIPSEYKEQKQILEGDITEENLGKFRILNDECGLGIWSITSDGKLELAEQYESFDIDCVPSVIKKLESDATIKVTGDCNADNLYAIGYALRNLYSDINPSVRVTLDFTNANWPASVTVTLLFADCHNLKSVTLPNTMVTITRQMFSNCENLVSVNIPTSVKTIDNYAFSGCSKLEINLGGLSNLLTINDFAFRGCTSLNTVNIPQSVTTIGAGAFSNCGNLVLQFIGGQNSPLGSKFSDGVMYNNSNRTGILFCLASKTGNFEIPSTVTTIATGAFFGSQISGITIPVSVTNIEVSAFEECNNLTTVIYEGTQSQRAGINIGDGNDILNEIEWNCMGE